MTEQTDNCHNRAATIINTRPNWLFDTLPENVALKAVDRFFIVFVQSF